MIWMDPTTVEKENIDEGEYSKSSVTVDSDDE